MEWSNIGFTAQHDASDRTEFRLSDARSALGRLNGIRIQGKLL